MVYLLGSFFHASLLGLAMAKSLPLSSRETDFSSSVLRYGTPESVSLLSQPLKDLEDNITGYLTPANYGSASFNVVQALYPGATVMYEEQLLTFVLLTVLIQYWA